MRFAGMSCGTNSARLYHSQTDTNEFCGFGVLTLEERVKTMPVGMSDSDEVVGRENAQAQIWGNDATVDSA